MKSFLILLSVVFTQSIAAQENPQEALEQLDRELIIERLKRAYAPVSFKLEGAWNVSNGSVTETWTYQNQNWKCPNSQIGCTENAPLSFKWFSLGKNWLQAQAAIKKLNFDFAGTSHGNQQRQVQNSEDDEPETQLQFEGKRTALEVWEWKSPFGSTLELGISLRDYLIERIAHGSGKESLEWATNSGSKSLSLNRVFYERDGQSLLFSRK